MGRAEPPERLSCEAGRLTEALDWLEQGLVILDAESRILFANAYARDLLAVGRGGLFVLNGRLQTRGPADGAILRSLMSRYEGGHPGGTPTNLPQPFRIGDPPLLLLAAPLTSSFGRPDPCSRRTYVLSIVDPGRAPLPTEREIRLHFGLTATEATVALDVLRGDGLKASARRLGISVETVRSHLRHIFDKTGVKRQAELVRLLLSSRHMIRGVRPPHGSARDG